MKPLSWTVTCAAFPYQVEGKLDDGRYFYFRFRSCRVSLGAGDTPVAAVLDSFTNEIEYHEDNQRDCPKPGFCTVLEGEEIAYVWQLLATTHGEPLLSDAGIPSTRLPLHRPQPPQR